MSTWSTIAEGGLAEYALVDKTLAAKSTSPIDAVAGAALANSSAHAMDAVKAAKVQQGDRVLVLGGSGGVGTIILQLVKNSGASFIATTSTQAELTLSLGADECLDYTREEWSMKYSEPFDVIIDCAEGVSAWRKANQNKLLKKGAKRSRFVAVVLTEWEIKISGWLSVMAFIGAPLSRSLRTGASMGLTPKYSLHIGESNGEIIAKVLGLVKEGKLRAIVDSESPYPLTTEGVRAAFR